MEITCPYCGETHEPKGSLCPACGATLKAEIAKFREAEQERLRKEEAERVRIEKEREEERQRKEAARKQKRKVIVTITAWAVILVGSFVAFVLWRYYQPINVYTRAIGRNPNDAEAYYKRGQIYDEKKEYGQAAADFNQAIAIDPNHAEAYNGRGGIYLITGALVQAAGDWEEALKLDPDNGGYQSKLRGVQAVIAEYDKEITAFTAALRRNPKNAAAYTNRGWRYYLTGNYQKALEDSNASLELRPDHANTLDTRAAAYQGLGDLDKAAADWEAAVRLDPKNAGFKDKLEKTKAGVDLRPELMETLKNNPREGTYTFTPRLSCTSGGKAVSCWLAKIVVYDGVTNLFLVSSPTGKGKKAALVFGPPSTLTLKDLDNLSKSCNAAQDAQWDENTGAWIITFKDVSRRFTYIETQPKPNWIIGDIVLSDPD